jgi:hypothetical protein
MKISFLVTWAALPHEFDSMDAGKVKKQICPMDALPIMSLLFSTRLAMYEKELCGQHI